MAEYKTRNLPLAAFILARGVEVPQVIDIGGRCEFVFDDPEEKFGWWRMEFDSDTPIPVQQFLWAQKELRAQMDRAFGRKHKPQYASR